MFRSNSVSFQIALRIEVSISKGVRSVSLSASAITLVLWHLPTICNSLKARMASQCKLFCFRVYKRDALNEIESVALLASAASYDLPSTRSRSSLEPWERTKEPLLSLLMCFEASNESNESKANRLSLRKSYSQPSRHLWAR